MDNEPCSTLTSHIYPQNLYTNTSHIVYKPYVINNNSNDLLMCSMIYLCVFDDEGRRFIYLYGAFIHTYTHTEIFTKIIRQKCR